MITAWTLEGTKTASQTTKGLRVLLVEDHADCAASMALLLSTDGHDVCVAADGLAALDEAQASQPDVVFLDIGLPGDMDGYEVAQRLRKQKGDKMPLIIALTGNVSEADQQHSAEVGIDLRLVKPIDMDHLLRLLRRFQSILDR